MTKRELLRALFALLYRDGGDVLGQERLEKIQHLIRREMDAEAQAGRMLLIKFENGFPHTIDGRPWSEWGPDDA